jgi:hypothetical protein
MKNAYSLASAEGGNVRIEKDNGWARGTHFLQGTMRRTCQ